MSLKSEHEVFDYSIIVNYKYFVNNKFFSSIKSKFTIINLFSKFNGVSTTQPAPQETRQKVTRKRHQIETSKQRNKHSSVRRSESTWKKGERENFIQALSQIR